MEGLKNIIWLEDRIAPAHKQVLEDAGLTVHLYQSVINKGRESEVVA